MVNEQQNPSGDAERNPVDDASRNPLDENRESDSVRYDTYRKVLGEKKKYQSELEATRKQLEEFQEKERLAQEQELKEQSKWQEYAQKKEEEAKELSAKINQFETREIQSRKLDAVLRGVNEEIPQKYWGLIELDAVKYDATTGEFDESSLNAEIQRIKNELPEILVRKKNASHDPSAPRRPDDQPMTPEKFAAMTKEQKKVAVQQFTNAPAWMRGQF